MANLQELLGDQIIENRTDQAAEAYEQIPINKLEGKVIGLYFSAHWCPPCRGFTPVLAKAYQDTDAATKAKFEIIFISSDRDQKSFDEYFKEMPWKSIPYSDRGRKEKLGAKFNVRGIPTLVVLSADGSTLTTDGRSQIGLLGAKAIQYWSEGKQAPESGADD